MDYPEKKPTGFARIRNWLACLFQGHLDGGYRTRWPGYDSVVCPRCLLTYTEMHKTPPPEPFQDRMEEWPQDKSVTLRVGGFITTLDYDEDGKLVDYQMEDWIGCKEEPGASPGRWGCSVIGGDEECLEDPDEMYQAIIRFWMRAYVMATSENQETKK